jgi:ABC-type transporter Mla subunit MlaD
MTAGEITALRAQACRVMAALGSTLDSLEMVAQIAERAEDPFSDLLITSQHLDEAAATADTLAQLASDLATAVDAAVLRTQAQVRELESECVPAAKEVAP